MDARTRFRQRLTAGPLLADGAMGTLLFARGVPQRAALDELVSTRPEGPRLVRRHASAVLLSFASALVLLLPIAATAAGPRFPAPVDGQAVYDEAGILSDAAIASAEATIDAIETRTAAEIVVYTQLVDYGVTTEETETRARADRPMGDRARRVR